MATAITSGIKNKNFPKIEPDLPTLASISAVEIDNIILNRQQGIYSIERLISKIKNMISLLDINDRTSSISRIDPRNLVIINRAIIQSKNGDNHNNINEVLKQVNYFLLKLNKIVENHNSGVIQDNNELINIRSFCIALSKISSSYSVFSSQMDYSHPFKR